MKKLVLLSALLFTLIFTTKIYAIENFNTFEIVAVENLNVGDNIEKVWKLSYSKDEIPATIVKKKHQSHIDYIVRTQYFEICYSVSKTGFGVKMLNQNDSKISTQINKAVLSSKEIKNQQIITRSSVSDEKAIGLIASYLPELLNDNYKHLLN